MIRNSVGEPLYLFFRAKIFLTGALEKVLCNIVSEEKRIISCIWSVLAPKSGWFRSVKSNSDTVNNTTTTNEKP